MGLRIGSTVINCRDLDTLTAFWSRALDLQPSSTAPGDDFRVLRGDRVNLSLQRSDTPVTGRGHLHLDLYTSTRTDEVRRLLGLGATYVRDCDDPDDEYTVLADPEGNVFCVCTVATEPVSDCADR